MGWLEELGVDALTLGAHVRSSEPRGLILMASASPSRGSASRRVESGRPDRRRRADAHRTPNVYAAGDVALAHNAAAGRRLAVEHWGEALNMGEVAGRTIAGEDAQWDVAPGFWSTIGEHTLKYVAWGDGFDEARARRPRRRRLDGLRTSARATLVGVLTHERDEDYEAGPRAARRAAA